MAFESPTSNGGLFVLGNAEVSAARRTNCLWSQGVVQRLSEVLTRVIRFARNWTRSLEWSISQTHARP
jgi:hypothetical protein